MDSLPCAVSLARALLSLERSRRTGMLHVMTELGGCRIALVSGVPRAASTQLATEEPLELACEPDGMPDPAHAEALDASSYLHGPTGGWLVEAGPVERPGLELALRRRLRDRVLHVTACQSLECRFEAGEPEAGFPLIALPLGAADLILAALRAQVAHVPRDHLFALVERGELQLSALGSMLVRTATLWPEEAAAVAWLADGVSLVRMLQLAGGADRVLRFSAALSLLSGLRAAPDRGQRFSLLVRKSEELRRTSSQPIAAPACANAAEA